jgi:hypothetical protein
MIIKKKKVGRESENEMGDGMKGERKENKRIEVGTRRG